MKVSVFLCIVIGIIMYPHFLYGNITELADLYVANQNKVKSLVGVGTVSIVTTDSVGKQISNIMSSVRVYMKYPNLIKMIIEEPVYSVIVQQGTYTTQKIGENGNVVTTKMEAANDLFKQFFSYELDSFVDASAVMSQETVEVDGQHIHKFIMHVQETPEIADLKKAFGVAEITGEELWFDDNGMLVKKSFVGDGIPILTTEMQYSLKEGIYVATAIRTILKNRGITVDNSIIYSSVSINTDISDKEFNIW
jgi:outer membrane lipoprotein-sorting protein